MMNDSLTYSDSTPSSSNNSNSNSLNRSFINSSIYGASDFFTTQINSINIQSKKRSKSLVSNCRDYFDQNFKKLRDELIDSKKIIKEKDEIIDKLTDIRDKLESEIRELTACLFQEAHLMVKEAKDEAALSQKLLNEANGKIEVLEAEVKALKALVLTSTPSEPNRHLHPQLINTNIRTLNINNLNNYIQINNNNNNNTNNNNININNKNNNNNLINGYNNQNNINNQLLTPNKLIVNKTGHKRTPSYNDMKNYHYQNVPILQTFHENLKNDENSVNSALKCEIFEIDPIYFKEIALWRENPKLDLDNIFISRVYKEDILPCINFSNTELVKELLNSIQLNRVCIEDISNSHPIETMQVCSLSNVPSICQYKIKINESSTSQWFLISKLCRNRITSVCDFFNYLRYIKDGLVKSDNRDVYWNIIDLRKRISLSRLGL